VAHRTTPYVTALRAIQYPKLAKPQPLHGLLAYRRVRHPTSVGMFLNVPLQQLCALPPGPLFAAKLDFQHRHFAPLVQYLTGMRQLRFTSATVMIVTSESGCVATFSTTHVERSNKYRAQ
jgi:hypothetical protein